MLSHITPGTNLHSTRQRSTHCRRFYPPCWFSLHLRVHWSTVSGGMGKGTAKSKGKGKGKDKDKDNQGGSSSNGALPVGSIIHRREQELFQFEILRMAWEQEDFRWGASEEARFLRHQDQ